MALKKNSSKIVLLDSHAILHRAYHALPDFATESGEPTGGLYGLSTMLIRIIGDLKPDYVIACFDLAEPTFRKQVYDNYKAHRPKTEDALISQIKRSREIMGAFGIPCYDSAGFEADDVIGTIVEKIIHSNKLELSNSQIIIASGDMDTLQLVVDDQVLVYTLKKGINDTVLYNESAVCERYGFAPEFLPDYKGLRGDPSDNIVGVSGIGEKTASLLISKFGHLENLYQILEKKPEKLIASGVKERIVQLLKDNEEEALFSKTLATIRRDAPIDFSLPEKTWRENFSLESAEKVFTSLEFRSLAGRVRTLVKNLTGEMPLVEEYQQKENTKPVEVIDEAVFKKATIATWLLDSDLTEATIDDIYRLSGKNNLIDALVVLEEKIKQTGLEKVYREIELPLIPIIKEAEERGLLVDTKKIKDLSIDYHRQVEEIKKKIFSIVGHEFNLNSPKQLGEILFTELGLSFKGLKKTAGGALSTRESELIKLRDGNPIIDLILEYRELQKLLTTYLDNIPALLDQDKRLHTNLNQTGTTTGRMSSRNPNLQNIPVRDGLGEPIRRAFVASSGHQLLTLDYSQIELRVLALLSEDAELIRIFKSGEDIHTAVAAKVFGVEGGAVTKEMRRKAKVINFGIIYGMGVNKLKATLETSKEEAQKFYDQYFVTFPTIKNYFSQVVSSARELGYTTTYFGRRRYFPGLRSYQPMIRSSAERMAMNAPLQGTAADLVKLAMIKADEELRKNNLLARAHLVLQVHDELIYEVEEEFLIEVTEILKKAMESAGDLPVPLLVSSGYGKSWGEIEK